MVINKVESNDCRCFFLLVCSCRCEFLLIVPRNAGLSDWRHGATAIRSCGSGCTSGRGILAKPFSNCSGREGIDVCDVYRSVDWATSLYVVKDLVETPNHSRGMTVGSSQQVAWARFEVCAMSEFSPGV